MADFASLDLLGSSPSDSASARTPSPNSWSYSPPGSVESMLAPSSDFPPPPSVFFHHQQQHHQQHTDIAFWPAVPHTSFSAAGPVPLPGRANSFLADMYDDKDAAHGAGHKSLDGSGMYLSPPGGIFRADWELGGSVGNSSAESSPSVHNLAPPPPAPAHEQYGYRRATYPYVQRDEAVYHSSPRNDGPVYAEPLPMDHAPQPLAADPAHLHARPMEDSQYVQHQQHQQQQQHSHHHHPHHNHHQHSHHPYAHAHSHGHPDDVKMEASAPPMVGGHQHYRPQQAGPPPSAQPMPTATGPTYMTHTGGIPIMHTDDAASKETQYLRRRCFNCHTTEPPSWRRSTLNPGKIVCNKCGLYERTHLRPRPHRFDELRATSKARKAASKGTQPAQQQQQQQQQMQAQQMVHQHMMHPQQHQPPQHVPSPSLSPKSQHGGYVKKEPSDEDYMRRASVGSVGSANMNGGHEWDQNAVHRLSHSPPSSHAASPIRLPSLPGAPMGSRTPEPQRSYVERRTSLPVGFDVPPSQRPREEEVPAQPMPQQWSQQPQGATMSVADLVDEEKARKTPTN